MLVCPGCSLAGVVGWVPGSDTLPSQLPGSPQLSLHPDIFFQGEKCVLDQPIQVTDPLEQRFSPLLCIYIIRTLDHLGFQKYY